MTMRPFVGFAATAAICACLSVSSPLLSISYCISVSQAADSISAASSGDPPGRGDRQSVGDGARADSLATLPWPEGTVVLPFDDLEGAILVTALLHQPPARDTSGAFVLDTGAGFLALDLGLARMLGVADSGPQSPSIGLAARPLARLQLGDLQVDQVSPVLTVDAEVMRRATGRPVLGLLGQDLFRNRALILDYAARRLVLLPPEAPGLGADSGSGGLAAHERVVPAPRPASPGQALSPRAIAVPFDLQGDGKVLIRARVGLSVGAAPETLDLIVDTGATKSVLFRDALERRVPSWKMGRSVGGLATPTLTGDARASIVRLATIEVGAGERVAERRGVDAAVLGGDLGSQLSSDVGTPVDGLLGYSFLKHFRLALDFPRRLLWLDPDHGDVPDRPFEYSSVGIQIEDRQGRVRVAAVAAGSPAALRGIRSGDELVALDGTRLDGAEVVAIARRLEGPPGSQVTLTMRRGGRTWSLRLARRQLL